MRTAIPHLKPHFQHLKIKILKRKLRWLTGLLQLNTSLIIRQLLAETVLSHSPRPIRHLRDIDPESRRPVIVLRARAQTGEHVVTRGRRALRLRTPASDPVHPQPHPLLPRPPLEGVRAPQVGPAAPAEEEDVPGSSEWTSHESDLMNNFLAFFGEI